MGSKLDTLIELFNHYSQSHKGSDSRSNTGSTVTTKVTTEPDCKFSGVPFEISQNSTLAIECGLTKYLVTEPAKINSKENYETVYENKEIMFSASQFSSSHNIDLEDPSQKEIFKDFNQVYLGKRTSSNEAFPASQLTFVSRNCGHNPQRNSKTEFLAYEPRGSSPLYTFDQYESLGGNHHSNYDAMSDCDFDSIMKDTSEMPQTSSFFYEALITSKLEEDSLFTRRGFFQYGN